MSAEVFRFVTVRPLQSTREPDGGDATIPLERRGSALVDALRRQKSAGSAAGMLKAAAGFVASDEFVNSRRAIPTAYRQFADAVGRLTAGDFWKGTRDAFERAFHATPQTVVTGEEYARLHARVADSIVAAAIDAAVPAKTRALLARLARALWLARRLADDASVSRDDALAAWLLFPEGILPLPSTSRDSRAELRASAEARAKRMDAQRERVTLLTTELAAHRSAAEELVGALERGGAATATRAGGDRLGGLTLAPDAATALTQPTRRVLDSLGLTGGRVDVAKAVALLDRRAAGIANTLTAEGGGGNGASLARVGDHFVRPDVFAGTLVVDPDRGVAAIPGPCPPRIDVGPVDDGVTVPTGHGEAKVLGMADLMVVEQKLLRYELGEIAHIENVLASELRARKFRIATTTERIDIVETETTETKERDLSSTERFELQTESATVINQTQSMDAGLTVTASYGPSVEATSNFDMASTSAKEESSRASATFAREITSKAVERIQSRELRRRTVRTVSEVEETNEHRFDNRGAGASNITGIYRFVDKIYRAQIVNYGKRVMFEFVVPEPAAFLRYALSRRPMDASGPVLPDPPGYCLDGKTFAPLRVLDVTRDNYLDFGSRYGAQDLTPPPPALRIATASKKGPDSLQSTADPKMSSETLDVAIPDGYLAQRAAVNVYGETQLGDHKLVIQVQNEQVSYEEPFNDPYLFDLVPQPTPAVTVTINSKRFHNYEMIATVFCTLSREKYEEWQLKTYTSIMNAYAELKSRYDQAVEQARMEASDAGMTGSNPAANRERERTELKKGCISLLGAQRFDLFDAVGRNVAPFGYPEIDFSEAKAESPYIQLFEQSFEWNNMTYLFYPYFWGSKEEWPTLVQLSDGDPLFAAFLRAGAARVQVPVRPGFVKQIIPYALHGAQWTGEGTIVNTEDGEPDPLHLSVIDELKSQTGNSNLEGVGTLAVTQGSASVTGTGTAFTLDDERRRIVIGGVTYVIKRAPDATTITLTTPYAGATDDAIGYALGGTLVGEPWEVKLPTDLVKLDDSLTIA
jgi:hypothetical protein